MDESQDTGQSVSRGNRHDGQVSRGRCSGLASYAEQSAHGENDQAGQAELEDIDVVFS
jgi:hypothetical protein